MSLHCIIVTRHETILQCNLSCLCVPAELFGGIVLIIVVGILYEGLKTLREVLAAREGKGKKEDINVINNDQTGLLTNKAKVQVRWA